LVSQRVLRRQSCPSARTYKRKIYKFVGLNTSTDKLIYDFFLFVRPFTNHAAITSSMQHFSYEAYSLLAGQKYFGCLNGPNNYCGRQKYYQQVS
jgi:hypothetical protein